MSNNGQCSTASAPTGSVVATTPSSLPGGTGWGFTLTYTPSGSTSCPDSLVCSVNNGSTVVGYLMLTATALYFYDVATWSGPPTTIPTATCSSQYAATYSCVSSATGNVGLSSTNTTYWYSVSSSASPLVVAVGSGSTIGTNQIAAIALSATAITSFNFGVPNIR